VLARRLPRPTISRPFVFPHSPPYLPIAISRTRCPFAFTDLFWSLRRLQHVLSQQQRHPVATGDLTLLLTAIQTTCKFISTNVRRAGLLNLFVPFPPLRRSGALAAVV
jgi:hypothetical protein